jgi:hypothetical protein
MFSKRFGHEKSQFSVGPGCRAFLCSVGILSVLPCTWARKWRYAEAAQLSTKLAKLRSFSVALWGQKSSWVLHVIVWSSIDFQLFNLCMSASEVCKDLKKCFGRPTVWNVLSISRVCFAQAKEFVARACFVSGQTESNLVNMHGQNKTVQVRFLKIFLDFRDAFCILLRSDGSATTHPSCCR